MLNESSLASAITSAIKKNRGQKKKSLRSVEKIDDNGKPVYKTEDIVDGPEDEATAIGKAIAAEIIKALKSGITIEGMISDLSAMHSGSLIGVGGGVPGPVTITSGAIKSSAGKIKITMAKVT